MPLVQYFGWVGSSLLALLFVANWCLSAPLARAPRSDTPLDRKINIRIHTDQKWPERVVFDTRGLDVQPERAAEAGRSEPPAMPDRRLDAFAEMTVTPVMPCDRPPCSTGRVAEASPIGKHDVWSTKSRAFAARKDLTFPSRIRRPPGRS